MCIIIVIVILFFQVEKSVLLVSSLFFFFLNFFLSQLFVFHWFLSFLSFFFVKSCSVVSYLRQSVSCKARLISLAVQLERQKTPPCCDFRPPRGYIVEKIKTDKVRALNNMTFTFNSLFKWILLLLLLLQVHIIKNNEVKIIIIYHYYHYYYYYYWCYSCCCCCCYVYK